MNILPDEIFNNIPTSRVPKEMHPAGTRDRLTALEAERDDHAHKIVNLEQALKLMNTAFDERTAEYHDMQQRAEAAEHKCAALATEVSDLHLQLEALANSTTGEYIYGGLDPLAVEPKG